MTHLLNLLAAIALLVWGTHLVRTGILRVFGANLRQLIAHSVSSRFTAVLSGIGVTAVVQASTDFWSLRPSMAALEQSLAAPPPKTRVEAPAASARMRDPSTAATVTFAL